MTYRLLIGNVTYWFLVGNMGMGVIFTYALLGTSKMRRYTIKPCPREGSALELQGSQLLGVSNALHKGHVCV